MAACARTCDVCMCMCMYVLTGRYLLTGGVDSCPEDATRISGLGSPANCLVISLRDRITVPIT